MVDVGGAAIGAATVVVAAEAVEEAEAEEVAAAVPASTKAPTGTAPPSTWTTSLRSRPSLEATLPLFLLKIM